MIIPVDVAHLVGLVVGLIIYGFNVALFLCTMNLVRWKTSKGRVVFFALIAIFVLCTAYYCLAIYDIYLAFIPFREHPGTIAYLNDYKDAIAPAKDIAYMISLLIADLLLVWRLYVICPSNRCIFAAAATLMCGQLAVGLAVSYYEVRQSIVGDSRYVKRVYVWTVGGSVLILCNNLLVTASIALRLWWAGRQMAILGQNSQTLYNRIIFVIVQSGAIYCTCIVLQLLLYAVGVQGAVYLFLHISPAVVALTPTAIVFQLNLKRPTQPDSEAKKPMRNAHKSTPWAFAWPEPSPFQDGSTQPSTSDIGTQDLAATHYGHIMIRLSSRVQGEGEAGVKENNILQARCAREVHGTPPPRPDDASENLPGVVSPSNHDN